jgi:hypothetical protein
MIPTTVSSLKIPPSSKNVQEAAAERTDVIGSSIDRGPAGGLANLRRIPGVAYEDNFSCSIPVTDGDEFGLRSRMVLSAMIGLRIFARFHGRRRRGGGRNAHPLHQHSRSEHPGSPVPTPDTPSGSPSFRCCKRETDQGSYQTQCPETGSPCPYRHSP